MGRYRKRDSERKRERFRERERMREREKEKETDRSTVIGTHRKIQFQLLIETNSWMPRRRNGSLQLPLLPLLLFFLLLSLLHPMYHRRFHRFRPAASFHDATPLAQSNGKQFRTSFNAQL